MRTLILLLSITLISSVFSTSFAKIYSWKDTEGRTVFGDNPPVQNKAKEIITQELTIVPGFKDPSLVQDKPQKKAEETKTSEDEAKGYEDFTVTYPNADEAIRTNDGNVTVSFMLSPALKSADSVFVYVDGKKVVENSKALSATLSNLDRGAHSLFAVIRNDNGDVLLNSNTVSFHVMRNSVISNRSR